MEIKITPRFGTDEFVILFFKLISCHNMLHIKEVNIDSDLLLQIGQIWDLLNCGMLHKISHDEQHLFVKGSHGNHFDIWYFIKFWKAEWYHSVMESIQHCNCGNVSLLSFQWIRKLKFLC